MVFMDYIKKVSEVTLITPLNTLIDWIAPNYQRKSDEHVNCGSHALLLRLGTSFGVPFQLQAKPKACRFPLKHPSIISKKSIEKRVASFDKTRKLKNTSSKQNIHNRTLLIPRSLLLVAVFFSLFVARPLVADDISTTDKYAWSENAGWLDFSSTHEQVTVYDDHLEGYVWSEAVGWIRLGTYTVGDTHTYANDAATTYGVNNDGSGNLSGYGWGENIGWVNFNSNNSQVTIDGSTGDFDGYAWSESIGWIHFQNTAPAYKVNRVIPDTTPDAFSFTDQTNVALSTQITSDVITVSGIDTNAVISITGGEYEINGSGTWTSNNGTVANTHTVKVRHTSSGSYSTAVNSVLTIGGVSDTFTTTTVSAPYYPPPTPTSTKTVSSNGVTATLKVTGSGKTLSQVSMAEKADNIDTGIHFPFGVVSFQVTTSTGGSVEVDITFNQNLLGTGFFLYKIDNAGNSTLIPQSFWQQNGSRGIKLTLTDGGPFDLDGVANGIIVDPIAIGEPLADTLEEFSLSDFNHAAFKQWISSELITIKGISQMTAVSVEGGLISIDGANFQSEAVEIGLGQSLQVLVQASDTAETITTATVTVGDYQTEFSVTTAITDLNDLIQYGNACSKQAVDEVIKAYIAYYHRPANTLGINYWSCDIDDRGIGFDSIRTDFTNTTVFNERFNGLTDEEVVDDIFQQLFNRLPNAEGQADWRATLSNDTQTRQSLPMAILNSATGNDLAIINNKIAVAEYFAQQYGQNNFDTQYYAHLLEQVTAESAAVETVKAKIDSQVNLLLIAKIPEIITEVNITPIETNSNYVNYFLLQTNKIRSTDISVAYKTLDGTAKAGTDYLQSSGRATIKAGQLQTAIPVTIVGDYTPENEEYYYLQISDPQGADFDTGVTEIKTKRTIIDDD